ncbi:MAG: histidinol-phosphate transaminase [Prevotellaceae bacterium]|jgi:histidinol-phosphate aminotransferase|nr:histidinol-phosphate transaminase [Prevotellaceae bacterium]
MLSLKKLVRPNIWNLKPYSSARSEFMGEASVFLDANENPYNEPHNRYPDPLQWEVKHKIAKLKGVQPRQILLGNGSDEPIDLLIRAMCEPAQDNMIAITPTYGMYKVAADVNNVEYREVLLDEGFDFTAENLLSVANDKTKIVWLCSPNNPTGNSLNRKEIVRTIEQFQGIVALDEAYIDFSSHPSFLPELKKYPNLVVLQTFSKAWASAGVRLGMAFASEEIINVLNKIKYPYNISALVQKHALQTIGRGGEVKSWVKTLLTEREKLVANLQTLPCILHVYPTDANFVLVSTTDANGIYKYLISRGIVIRNRNNITLCEGCIRITVGTPQENEMLINEMQKL